MNNKKQRIGLGQNFRKGNLQEQIHRDKNPGQNGPAVPAVKRPADKTSTDQNQKRPAFGDLTNATLNVINETLKGTKKGKGKPLNKGLLAPKSYLSIKSATKKNPEKSAVTVQDEEMGETITELSHSPSCHSSQGSVSSSQESSQGFTLTSSQDTYVDVELMETSCCNAEEERIPMPDDVDDVDTENLKDPVQVALYASEIFEYYKEREKKFNIQPYLVRQPQLSVNMRSILVDWLVEVQENFELNHETLYLAVKLVDMYLSKKSLSKEFLQLVGASALFISCKFDERCPPLIEDFLYICDDAYNRKQFIDMEKSILRTVDFDLGIPLSYRFLRRYAKCCRATMETLTLARYILELSLMEYNLIQELDSKLAAATLYLAFKMKQSGNWTPTLEFYTGYQVGDIIVLVKVLNKMVAAATHKPLITVRSKYSHEVFYKVAKLPAVEVERDLMLQC